MIYLDSPRSVRRCCGAVVCNNGESGGEVGDGGVDEVLIVQRSTQGWHRCSRHSTCHLHI